MKTSDSSRLAAGVPSRRTVLQLLAAAALWAALPPAVMAQAASTPAGPVIGQVSKDSVWVPTPERMIHRMLQLADTTAQDVVLDLGSGDGRIPIYAAKHFGARSIGVELEQNLIDLSIAKAKAEGVDRLASFLRQDLFEADLSKATVFALYISPGVMTKLKPRFLALKPGTRVTSHHFTLDDWEPDETIRTENRMGYLWVVPADARGAWTVTMGGDTIRLRIDQKYQMLKIQGERSGRPVNVIGERLRGTEIQFTSFDRDGSSRHFRGRIAGSSMDGDSEGLDVKPLRWSAKRD